MRAVLAVPATPDHPRGQLLDGDVPWPEPGPEDLLVRIQAVAVNPVDLKVHASLAAGSEPRLLGWDAAGVVEAVGASVTRFRPGDAVWFAGDIGRPGCYAAATLVDHRLAGHCPSNLSWAEAAALPLTTLTAWEALFEQLRLDPDGGDRGRSLLIIGGAGGVGSIAIQLARQAGLRVLATASRPESRAWVRQLGAEAVLDHSQPLPPQLASLGLTSVDRIANFADTDAYWQTMAELISPRGAIVAIVGSRQPLDLEPLKAKSASFHWEFMFTRPRFRTADMDEQGRILERLAARIESGALRSTMTRCFEPICAATLQQAHDQLRRGRTLGKVVLLGWEPPGGG
ncbi:MAG: zinc-binding alcohol dehydrogenase family protein [Synechococcaceae cyanobacterium]|nr:zinc-binding alcohol dehydrogenase family protein [Synechococcaceae cyanobacterium]